MAFSPQLLSLKEALAAGSRRNRGGSLMPIRLGLEEK
jgi:hypothetical protein